MQTTRFVWVAVSLIFLACSTEAITFRLFDFGSALRFDGSQDFVALPDMHIGAPLTIEMLIRPRGEGTVLEFGNPDGTQKIQLSLDNNNRLEYSATSSSVRGPRSSDSARSTFGLTANAWNYVVITINNNGRIDFFNQIFGLIMLPIGSGSLSFAPANVNPPRSANFIGRDRAGDNYFEGDLDEIRIWNRVFSSWDMNRYRSIQGNEPTLVAWWDFNQGVGALAQDLSANQYHGSLGDGSVAFRPSWIPASFAETGTCSVWGETTVKSFDKKSFTMSKPGEYWLANSQNVDSFESDVKVQFQLQPTKRSASVSGLAFTSGDHLVVIDLDFSTKDYSTLTLDGEPVQTDSLALSSGAIILKSYDKHNKHTYDIELPFVGWISVVAEPKKQQSEIDIKIFKEAYGGGKGMTGVCGNYNGQSNDDTSSGVTATHPVDPSESLFSGPHQYPDIPPPVCDPAVQLPESVYQRARSICYNTTVVADFLNETCMFDVCVTGDLTLAAVSALATYRQCVEDYINGGSVGENPCEAPCPAFCSFQGQCINGTCSCDSNYYGNDCSQQAEFPCFEAKWNVASGGVTTSTIINPFIGTESVSQHYAYGKKYSKSSDTGNEVKDSSIVYLYEQRPARNAASVLSLVLLNDKAKDGSGGDARASVALTRGPAGSPALRNVQLSVKNDPSDRYTVNNLANGGTMSAKWGWSSCCTAGLALTGFPTTTDFCAALDLDELDGIEQVFVASQNQFGTQDLHSVPLNARATQASSISICGTNCTNRCGMYAECASCAADPDCGWCVDSNTCEFGDSSGPQNRRCTQWRYSNLEVDSRVVNTPISYPVDPAEVDFYLAPSSLAASPLNLTFFVTVPSNEAVVQEVVLLQELTSSWASDLSVIRGAAIEVYNEILEEWPNTKLGVASFTDKPQLPYGVPASLDYTYKTHASLTKNRVAIQKALNEFRTCHGGDDDNAQLSALIELAQSDAIGWTDKARHIVVVITRSGFHEGQGYPTRSELRSALLARNIIPIFLSPGGSVLRQYQQLVSDLGFGFANVYSLRSLGSVFCEAINSLSAISTTAKVVTTELGQIASITPSEYHGISPKTRIAFHVQLNDKASAANDSTLVIPGFGSVHLHRVASDNPVPECPCPKNVTLESNTQTVVKLTGSYHRGPVKCNVVRLPQQAKLYQYKNGQKGDLITSPDTECEDPSNQIILEAPETTADTSDSMQYLLQDSCLACSRVQTLSIGVIGGSQPPPVANPSEKIYLNEDTRTTITLGGTPTSPPIYSMIVSFPDSVQGTLYEVGTWNQVTSTTKLTNNAVDFVPAANRYGTGANNFATAFTFKVVRSGDGATSTNQPTMSLYIVPVNDPPTVPNSFVTISVDEDSAGKAINMIASEVWGESSFNQLKFHFITLPQKGDLYPCASTACTPLTTPQLVNGPLSTVFYKPRLNQVGSDSFTYRANDGQLNSTVACVVPINITPFNDPPVATFQAVTAQEDVELPIVLSGTDPDGDTLSAILCSWGGPGTLKTSTGVVIPIGTTEAVLSSTTVRYLSPSNQYSGFPNSPSSSVLAYFSFRVRDPSGANSASCANINITVAEVNDLATASAPSTVNVDEDNSTVISLTGLDVDPFDHPLRFTICTPPAAGTLSHLNGTSITSNDVVLSSAPSGGSSLAQVRFTPVPGEDGNNYASFSFKVDDRRSGTINTCNTITINVLHVNHAPVAGDVPTQTVDEDGQVAIQLLGSDVDVGDSLTFQVTSLPASGALYQAANDGQHSISGSAITVNQLPLTITTNPNGWVVFVPEPNENGSPYATFQFAVNDGQVTSGWSTVTVNANAINDDPVAVSRNVTVAEDGSVVIDLSSSVIGYDVDNTPGQLSVVLNTTVSAGTLTLCSDSNCASSSAVANGDVLGTNQVFVKFVPLPDQHSSSPSTVYSSFTYQLRDASNAWSNVAVFDIYVTPVNDAPVCVPLSANYTTDEFTPILLTLGATDIDSSSLEAVITQVNFKGYLYQYDNGTLGGQQITDENTIITDPLFRVFYVPMINAYEEAPFAVIQYKVDDGDLSCTSYVEIFVTHEPVPPPTPLTSNITLEEDTPVVFPLQAVDNNDPLAVFEMYVLTLPSLGSLFQIGASVPINASELPALVTDPNGNLRFEPPLNLNNVSASITSFNYKIRNTNTNQNATGTTEFYVTPVNDRPTMSFVAPTAIEDTPLLFQLTGDDVDIYYEGDNLTAWILVVPGIGGVLHQVDENFNRIDPKIPFIAPGDRIQVTNSQHYVMFIPNQDLCGDGIVLFQYQMRDSHGLFSPVGTVPIDIECVNDPPIIINDKLDFSGDSNTGIVQMYVLYSDADLPTPFQGGVIATITLFPTRGTLEDGWGNPLNETHPDFIGQTVMYKTTAHQVGNPYDHWGFKIRDLVGVEDGPVNRTISIYQGNRPPYSTSPDSFSGVEDTPFLITLSGDDPDGDSPLQLSVTTLPTHGVLYVLLEEEIFYIDFYPVYLFQDDQVGRNFSVWYQPSPNYNTHNQQPDWIEFNIEDGQGQQLSTFPRVDLYVLATNDAPFFNNPDTPAATVNSTAVIGNALMADFIVSDDSFDDVLVDITSNNAQRIYFTSNGTLNMHSNTTETRLVFSGTITEINAAFASGFVFVPVVVPSSTTGWINVTVNDLGNDDEVATSPQPLISSKLITVDINVQSEASNNNNPTAAATGVVGVTAVTSMASYAAYKYLKRKNILPEEADPWENDEMFDATLDNPLYSMS